MHITYKELQQVIERATRESNSPYASRYYPGITGRRVITEGLSWKDMLKDIAGAAASSGALVVTGGAGGDVVVDTLFAIDTGKEILETVKSAIAALKEAGAVIGRAIKLSISSGPAAFMAEVKAILIDVMGMIGKKAKKVVNKLAKSIQGIIDKVVRAISKWVAALFPADFGLAGPGFEATVTTALASATETAFDSTMGAINSLGETGRFLIDPAAMEQWLEDITVGLLDFTDELQVKIDNPDPDKSGFFKGLIAQQKHQYETMLSVTGLASLADKMGFQTDSMGEDYLQMIEALPSWHPNRKILSAILPKITSFLETARAEYIPLAGKIMSKLMSYLFACIALLQLISDPEQREEILDAADKKDIERSKAISNMTPEERAAASKKAGEDIFGSDVDLDLGLSERKLRKRRKRMRISERRLRQQIRRTIKKNNIRRLVEQTAAQQIKAPAQAEIDTAVQAIESGADRAAGEFDPSVVTNALKSAMAKLGFVDPCEYVKKERAAVEAELKGMHQLAAQIRGAEDPVAALQSLQGGVKMAGVGVGGAALMGNLLGKEAYASTFVDSLDKSEAAMGAAKQLAGGSAVTGAQAADSLVRMIPGVGDTVADWTTGHAVKGAEAVAAAGTAQLDAAKAAADVQATAASVQASTILGVQAATWATVGYVIAAIAIAIFVWKWMLKSGMACTMVNFAKDIAGVITGAVKWAYTGFIKPFAQMVWKWGTNLVDMALTKIDDWWGSDDKKQPPVTEGARRQRLVEARRRQRIARSIAINEWRRFNEAAMAIYVIA